VPDSAVTVPLLEVADLSVAYHTDRGEVFAVKNLSFAIRRQEVLALVGESGSGKTSAALAVLGYLGRGGRIAGGNVRLQGVDLALIPARERRAIYGRRIAHVAQDPSSSLDPAMRIGDNLMEGMFVHFGLSKKEAYKKALTLLGEVQLPNPETVMACYPHQLSGGMQQRVCIAMALACDPELIVMDEPTTGLDAATEAAIFKLLKALRQSRGISILFISHNLAAVRGIADKVIVMYHGKAVEIGENEHVFNRPAHRYTSLLFRALPTMRAMDGMPAEILWQDGVAPDTGCAFRPRCDMALDACGQSLSMRPVAPGQWSSCVRSDDLLADAQEIRLAESLADFRESSADARKPDAGVKSVLRLDNVTHSYGRRGFLIKRGKEKRSLDDVSFDVQKGKVTALIGESGSGKSTLARCIVGLERVQRGAMVFQDTDLAPLRGRPVRIARRLQIVFQNIAGSLHPRKTIADILARPIRLYEKRSAPFKELETLTHSVGIKSDLLYKRPSGLSGGERQRVALARAFSSEPSLLVLDEAFSALDVSMKVKVMNLLRQKKSATGMGILLITHELPIVRFLADRVAVLYRGWLCEDGPVSLLRSPPMHPYTETLLWSALELEGLSPAALRMERFLAPGSVSAETPSEGCPFQLRCPRKVGDICEKTRPPRQRVDGHHSLACHIPVAELGRAQQSEWPTSIAASYLAEEPSTC